MINYLRYASTPRRGGVSQLRPSRACAWHAAPSRATQNPVGRGYSVHRLAQELYFDSSPWQHDALQMPLWGRSRIYQTSQSGDRTFGCTTQKDQSWMRKPNRCVGSVLVPIVPMDTEFMGRLKQSNGQTQHQVRSKWRGRPLELEEAGARFSFPSHPERASIRLPITTFRKVCRSLQGWETRGSIGASLLL